MRKAKEVKEEVLSRAGRYREVHPEGSCTKDPSPLKVKEVRVDDRRYIVCLNEKLAWKALQEITLDDRGKTLAIRSECLGTCGKVFQAVGVAIPSSIREVV